MHQRKSSAVKGANITVALLLTVKGVSNAHLLSVMFQSCMLSHGLCLILTQPCLKGLQGFLKIAALGPQGCFSPRQLGIVHPQLQQGAVCL